MFPHTACKDFKRASIWFGVVFWHLKPVLCDLEFAFGCQISQSRVVVLLRLPGTGCEV